MNGKTLLAMAITATALAALSAVVYAQDKFDREVSQHRKSPGGIAFADFRGYEDWSGDTPPPAPIKSSRSLWPTRR